MLHRRSDVTVIARGKIIKDINIPNELNKGVLLIKKGTKGCLEKGSDGYTFELDNPIKYPNWFGKLYRLTYSTENERKMQVKCFNATNNEKIDYIDKQINISRSVSGLERINLENIRFCLNMALVNKLNLNLAIHTYLNDIEMEAKKKWA